MKNTLSHKPVAVLGILLFLLCVSAVTLGHPKTVYADTSQLNCIAFSPYINGYDPNFPNDPKKIPSTFDIDHLLDILVQRKYNCILTYGVNPPLDYVFSAAQARGIKVIANIWLEAGSSSAAQNATSITNGINAAKTYPGTIIRLSCGVEVRTRAENREPPLPISSIESVINDCINQVRNAGVTQPVTTIDSWWNWCNGQWPCQSWSMVNNVDWIGINVYPWWENKYSGIFPCIPASAAPQFHLDRFADVKAIYPGKEVILTEFGWPAGPDGFSETNIHTGQKCGIASQGNQDYIRIETLKKLAAEGIQGVVFEAFREPWKVKEGSVGPFWGIIAPSFNDVPITHDYYNDIETLYVNGLTGGCSTSPMKYCPDQIMNRAMASVFMVRGAYGAGYIPNPTAYKFKDDWSKALYARPWAEAMREANLTTGCKASPLLYCPLDRLNREQAVIFGLKMRYGMYYLPPPATGTVFADMTDPNYWAAPWVEQAYKDGLITACGTSGGKPKFCPKTLVTRGLGAYIIVRAKNLTMP